MLDQAFYCFLEHAVDTKQLSDEFYLDSNKQLQSNLLKANNLCGTEVLRPGSLVLLPERSNVTSNGLKRLAQMSSHVSRNAPNLSGAGAQIINANGGLLAGLTSSDNLSGVLTHGSAAVGNGASYVADRLELVGKSMKKVDQLYRSQLQKHGNLKSPEFFAQRKALESNIQKQLTGFSRSAILKNGESPILHKAMGISSKRAVKQFKLHGNEFRIREVEQALGRVSKLASSAQKVGAVAQFVSLGLAANEVASEFKEKGVVAGSNKLGQESASLLGATVGGVIGSQAAIAALTFAVGVTPVGLPLIAAGLVGGALVGTLGSEMAKEGWNTYSGAMTEQAGKAMDWVAQVWD